MSRDEMNEWIFPIKERFKLSEKFLEDYIDKEPNWGPLGKLTYKRTYAARIEGEDRTEEWFETVKRVVETCYTIQLNHCKNLRLPWHAHKAQKSAQEMYSRMFSFKFIPPGRGLANMGDVVFKRGSMGLFNCSAVSTNSTNFSDPYVFMMDVSMCGVGVGFDTEGAGKFRFVKPKTTDKPHVVEDSREGWCEVLRVVLEAYVGKEHLPTTIDYSQIRPTGSPIVTSGGIAPGPQPLIDCITRIQALMVKRVDKDITSSDIVDLMNIVGVCVVAGGKRRCLPEYTEVHTKDGLIPIKDVKVGQEVLTMDGWKKVVDHVYQGKQETMCIKTSFGDFRCTTDHRMKVYTKDKEICFKEANHIPGTAKLILLIKDVTKIPKDTEILKSIYNELTDSIDYYVPLDIYSFTLDHEFEETYDISVEDNHEFVCSYGLVSHNTAQIAFGNYNDKEYISLKDPDLYQEELMSHRWASNNSIYAEDGMDYSEIINTIKKSGEPGILYKHRMQNYGRIKDGYQEGIDGKATLLNPCGEISLEDQELCNISDVFPANHDSFEDFKRSLKFAYLYCKTVTLIPTHLPTTNSKILKNRRIGISQSGIVQAIQKHGTTEYFRWCDEGYTYMKNLDKKYSDWLCIQKSIKLTTVKPAGSTSLLMGSTPGIHFEHSEYYIRRIRVEETNVQLVQAVKDAGYKWEVSAYGDRSIVFEVPVKAKNFYKGKSDVSVWEQMQLGSKIQSLWSDNSVSQTVTFTKDEAEYLKNVIEMYEDQFKTVSFLPLLDHNYVQAPYQTITKEEYEQMIVGINPINFSFKQTQDIIEKFCDGDKCTF